jgi:hypothetical protein
MTTPGRHWRSYGDEPLPTGKEALDEPFAAFSSWFMRITCDRNGCGNRTGRVELLTGIEGASSRPVRRIVLRVGDSSDERWQTHHRFQPSSRIAAYRAGL